MTFVATAGGRVATPIVSTGADGVASPGVWTLGDIPGDQSVVATVESAVAEVHATATGTPIHLLAEQVSAAGFATCALVAGGATSCWGKAPLVGDGDTLNRSGADAHKGWARVQVNRRWNDPLLRRHRRPSALLLGIQRVDRYSGQTVSRAQADEDAWRSRLGPSHDWLSARLWARCRSDPVLLGEQQRRSIGRSRHCFASATPAPVYGGFKFSSLSAGRAHTCAVTVTRSAFCWGRNVSGQLGDGTMSREWRRQPLAGRLSFVASAQAKSGVAA